MFGWFLLIGCIVSVVLIAVKQGKEAEAYAPAPVAVIFRVPFYLFVCALVVLFYTYTSAAHGSFALYWFVLFLELIYSIAFVIYRIWFLRKNHPKSAKRK